MKKKIINFVKWLIQYKEESIIYFPTQEEKLKPLLLKTEEFVPSIAFGLNDNMDDETKEKVIIESLKGSLVNQLKKHIKINKEKNIFTEYSYSAEIMILIKEK